MRARHAPRPNNIVRVKGWNIPQKHYDFDPETEHIHEVRVMTPLEAQRINRNTKFRSKTGEYWVLASQMPVSEEDPQVVEAALDHIERTMQHEAKSLPPSQLGGEQYRRACGYHNPNSSVKHIAAEQRFSDLREI